MHIDAGASTLFDEESMADSESDMEDVEDLQQADGRVDMVVVDRAWGDQESYVSPSDEVQTQNSETEKLPGDGDVEYVMNEPITTSNKWRLSDTLRWPVWLRVRKFMCAAFSDERLEHIYAEVHDQ